MTISNTDLARVNAVSLKLAQQGCNISDPFAFGRIKGGLLSMESTQPGVFFKELVALEKDAQKKVA